MTPTTIECKSVYRLLNTYLLQHTSSGQTRNFKFSTIQINGDLRNPRGPVGCCGPYATTVAGPFRGGALRHPSSEAKCTAIGAGETAPAATVFLATRNKVWLLDGAHRREVAPFDGQRTSIEWTWCPQADDPSLATYYPTLKNNARDLICQRPPLWG